MFFDQWDRSQEDEQYNEDDEDLYPPTSDTDFRATFGALPNPGVIPSSSNTVEKNIENSQKMEKMTNSMPSTSKIHHIDDEYVYKHSTPNDQSMVISDAHIWTRGLKHVLMETWIEKNMRNQNESHGSNNDSLVENECLRKNVDLLEKNLANSQEQLDAYREQLKQLQFEKEQLYNKLEKHSKDAELQRKQFDELSQKHSEAIANLCGEMELLRQNYKTSQDAALEVTDVGLKQSQNVPVMVRTSTETMPDPSDNPALNDCQLTFSLDIDQPFDMNEEPIEEQESGNCQHISTIIYPGAASLMEHECESNSKVHFHGSVEEARNSVVAHSVVIVTNQASDNGNIQLSELNEVQTSVDSNPSDDITPSSTSQPITAEITPLKCAKRPNKQIGTKASTKRGRLSRIEQNPPQIWEDNSLASSIVDCQNQQQNGFGESSNENETDNRFRGSAEESATDDESEYGLETEPEGVIISSKDRTQDRRKENHRESKVQSNSRPKRRSQFKKKQQISQRDVGSKRTVGGEKRHKCQLCRYATNNKGDLTKHVRRHTEEKPFKCNKCNYAAADNSNLIRHIRSHTKEKPYKCRLCKYATAQSHHLTEHIRIHTGKKPYKCRFCEFASGYDRSLNLHMRKKHKGSLKTDLANSKKNTARNMLNNSRKNVKLL